MAEQIVLDVSPRTVFGKANKRLRKAGKLPANVYGHKVESTAVQVDAIEFEHLRRRHGTRNVLTLRLDGAPEQTVLVHHVQHDPLTGGIIHVDFTRVDARERIESKIPLNFHGDAPGVKIEGGVFLPLVDALTIACEAADIVDHLDVDISSLTEIDAIMHAKDIPLSVKYTLVTDPEEPVAKIAAPRVEAVTAAVPEPELQAPIAPATPASTEE